MLIGLAVRGAALALTVGARAALGATVAAGLVPGLLRPLAVIATEEQQRHKSRIGHANLLHVHWKTITLIKSYITLYFATVTAEPVYSKRQGSELLVLPVEELISIAFCL